MYYFTISLYKLELFLVKKKDLGKVMFVKVLDTECRFIN